jgi:3-methyl-2-oxobutanoate hydroxymethyltransferase
MSFRDTKNKNRLTLKKIAALSNSGQKLAMLTAYDAITAALLDQSGIDLILVGDSLGNVILGHETTLPVTLDDMIRHTAAVVRGTEHAFVICDLPFGTAHSPEIALENAIRVFRESGAQAVKIEGGAWAAPIVQRLVEQGIPVMAHIGLTPQSIHQLGGYHRHGKTGIESQKLLDAALVLEEAGAFAIVLECIIPEVAALISEKLHIPTIGIGSGQSCDGQVLVINDLIGLNTRTAPSFAKPRADVATLIRTAVREYITETKQHSPQAGLGAPTTHGNC